MQGMCNPSRPARSEDLCTRLSGQCLRAARRRPVGASTGLTVGSPVLALVWLTPRSALGRSPALPAAHWSHPRGLWPGAASATQHRAAACRPLRRWGRVI